MRTAHPRLGGLILALTREPQSTAAWQKGAAGEESLGARLDALTGPGIGVLHDRRIPDSRANVDHIVVCPSGVLVIDAKRYDGRPRLKAQGGLFTRRTEHLVGGGRRRTKLVDGVGRQVACVQAALADAAASGESSAWLADVPVRGALCFIGADWPVLGGSFLVSGVAVLWPRKALALVSQPGPVGPSAVQQVRSRLASVLPRA